jgi:ribosome biogenesis GTPase
MRLDALGWNPFFADHFQQFDAEGLLPGRVCAEHQHIYRVYTDRGELTATVAGRLRHHATGRQDFPAIGDWVAVRPFATEGKAVVEAILPRRSRFSRKVAGATTEEQVVAANVDTVFLVVGLDDDFNPRRLERYLLLAWDSAARPVILLTKADLHDDVSGMMSEASRVAPGVPVHAVSARTGRGLESLDPYLQRGETIALLGSSGVGKSTLINSLLGVERLRTREVRAQDGRGRHTTSHRELVVLPSGALVIDTPGMRELRLWDVSPAAQAAFADIEALAADCFFDDCRHESEPRCGVKAAVESGTLAASRLESYRKLQRELVILAERQDKLAAQDTKKRLRGVHRAQRKHKPR